MHEQVALHRGYYICDGKANVFVSFSLAEYSDKRARCMHVLPSYVATEIVGKYLSCRDGQHISKTLLLLQQRHSEAKAENKRVCP